MIKIAMIEISALLKREKVKSRLLLQVHDELLFDLHNEDRETLPQMIQETMENALPLPHQMPAKVESGGGQTWLEGH